MKKNISSFIIASFLTLFIVHATAQTTEQDYIVIADTIINKIVKLDSQYPQLDGIANNETFRNVTKSEDHTTITLHFIDSRARGMNKDYYLILDLNFYICKKTGCVVIADEELSIGNMQINLVIDGKGNDELTHDVEAIIKKSKTDYEQK